MHSANSLFLLLAVSSSLFAGFAPSTVTLTSSANPSVLGRAVTFTASVVPPAATGKVTFYDGTQVLETEPMAGGRAVMTTTLLPSGAGSITCYYGGDATYGASRSTAIAQVVTESPSNGFLVPVNYAASLDPDSVTLGDFNRDGKADLAVANYIGKNLSVLLGNGDGTFQAAVNYSIGEEMLDVVVGDFNGDGNPDLAASSGIGAVVLLGNGDGTFQSPIGYDTSSLIVFVAVADFNGDGNADLVLSGSDGIVLLGNGDGTFQGPRLFDYSFGGDVTVADFNGDGKADVAGFNSINSTLTVLLGNGDGTFQTPIISTVFGQFMVTGDFNRDGKADLALTDGETGDVLVLLGNSDGTFQPAVTYVVADAAGALAVGDFNADGRADVAVGTGPNVVTGIGNLNILLGNGDGTFQPAESAGTFGSYPAFLNVADLNGDGRPDIAAVVNSVLNSATVFLGNAKAETKTTLTSSADPSTFGEAVTLLATVSPSTASGSVAFADGSTPLGSGPLVAGEASIVVSSLSTGAHSLTAFYGGDINDGNGISPIFIQTVVPAVTSTKLGSSVNPSVYGETIALVAAVLPATSTGTVTFLHGSTILGSATLAGGSARLGISKLVVGSNALTAVYGGDTNDATSTSPILSQMVVRTPTETKLASSPNPSKLGQSVTLTANVLPLTAAGKVTFRLGSTVLGAVSLSHGTAKFATSTLATGSQTLTAVYSGSTDDLGSTSPTVVQVVQ